MADSVEEIKNKIDIVDIIGAHVNLKKAGSNYKGLCPFHQEKTPSFMVSPELQIYKCFGCGESGDVFTFLEKYEGLEFREALEVLAEKAGVKLESKNFGQKSKKERSIEINTQAARLYHYLLLKHPSGKEALEYATKVRGLKSSTLTAFEIGFAPERSGVLTAQLKKKNMNETELVDAGLVYKTRYGLIERFRGRLIFPLKDHRGRTLALAGRILPQYDKPNIGKYINSPEIPSYHKSEVVYGLDVAKSEIKKLNQIVIVEGELDLLTPWQIGVKNIIAIKGTAFTDAQIRLLSRFSKNWVMALDSDFAGDRAAVSAIQSALNMGISVKVAKLGKYKDPDDFAKAEPEKFKSSIAKAQDAWDFLFEQIFTRYNPNTGSGKAAISREIAPLLSAIDDSIVQDHYIKKIASKLDVGEEAVRQKITNPKREIENELEVVREAEDVRLSLEKRLISVSLQNDPKYLLNQEVVGLFTKPFTKKLMLNLPSHLTDQNFDPQAFSKSLPPELRSGFNEVYLQESGDSLDVDKELTKITIRLKIMNIHEQMEKLTLKMKQAEKKGNEDLLQSYEEEFATLSKKRSEIEGA